MADGYLGKCKDCTKRDSENRRKYLTENDPVWVEKEAERQRLKEQKRYYEKLKGTPEYNGRMVRNRSNWETKYPEKRDCHLVSSSLERKKGFHNHHWSYKKENWGNIIQLQSKRHAFIHRYLEYVPEEMCYKSKEGELLNTKEKHMNFLLTLPF